MTSSPNRHKAQRGHLTTEAAQKKRKRRRKPSKRQETDLEIVHRLLLSPVSMMLNGGSKRISAIEAIISQLQFQEISGNARASRILVNVRKLVKRGGKKHVQIVFVEGANTGEHPGEQS